MACVKGIKGYVREPKEARFWAKVDIRGNECWNWKASLRGCGYGGFWDGDSKRNRRAHVIAWELTYGPIPPRMCVCHHCDNPKCCNPTHLWLGTHKENYADMVQKGRAPDVAHRMRRRITTQRAATHCKRGHLFPPPDENGWRECKICKKAADAARARRVRFSKEPK